MILSLGYCELCKQRRPCVDVRSDLLPKPEPHKCNTCGDPVAFEGAEQCNTCWEVEGRIDIYLANEKGIAFITKKLRELALRWRGAAKAIEIEDEDELERYAAELERARDTVTTAELNKLMGMIQQNDFGEAKKLIRKFLRLDQLRLSEIYDLYGDYFLKWPEGMKETCPHGNNPADCDDCDRLSDHAFDAAREDSR
jgi:hypothetical protein